MSGIFLALLRTYVVSAQVYCCHTEGSRWLQIIGGGEGGLFSNIYSVLSFSYVISLSSLAF